MASARSMAGRRSPRALPFVLQPPVLKQFALKQFVLKLAAAIFMAAVSAASLSAQQKAAEGEYTISGTGFRSARVTHRWTLYGDASGGYRLESEVQNLPGRLRIVEKEQLNAQLAPASVTYEMYDKAAGKIEAVLGCSLGAEAVWCSGGSGKEPAPASEPFKTEGPVWLVVADFGAVDMAWNVGGALNMARAPGNKSPIKLVTVSGGAALVLSDRLNIAALEAAKRPGQSLTAVVPEQYTGWELSAEEDLDVALQGTEQLELGGTKIATQHYTIGNQMHAWVTNSGLIVKLLDSHDNESTELTLSNFRQYTRLVPELKVEGPPAAQPKK